MKTDKALYRSTAPVLRKKEEYTSMLRIAPKLLLCLCVFKQIVLAEQGAPFSRGGDPTKRVSLVVVCDEIEPFGESRLIPLTVITNRETVNRLYKEINSETTDDTGYPFSGVLSYQVFVDASSNVLAISHIVDYKFTVVAQESGYRKGTDFYLFNPSDEGKTTSNRTYQSETFVREISEALKSSKSMRHTKNWE
ncbi:MAG TPA: hypothetical protein PLG04_04635 [Anaerolineaceae bacterium]|nr:hypothetical protein [Anaerolineaceae bacterium]HRT28587.1 hypothetical protein [Kiritimatiellia bacterium]